MKRCKVAMLVIAFGLSIITFSVLAGTYIDDFGDGVDNGWIPLIGEWKAEDGFYKQVGEGDLWQRAMLKTINGIDYRISNFEVSVTAQLPNGNSGWLGLVFLHGNIDESKPAISHYTFSLTYDGRNIVRLYKSSSGVVGQVDWKVDEALIAETGKWYTFKVVVQGQRIDCYANDSLLITNEDEEISEAGKVGIFATKAPGAIFSEFRLIAADIPDSIASPVRPFDKLAITWGKAKAD